jgi:hypothetical protein
MIRPIERATMFAGLAVAAALAAGCGEGADLQGDCEERLVWNGHDYGGTRARPPLGERLGRTATLGCGGEPNRRVTIFGIRGVSPSVAIAVRPDGEPRFLGLGPGYIVESPRHPLHRAVFGSDDAPDAYEGQRCRRPRSVVARAVTTPVYEDKPLKVAAARRADRPYLRGRGVRGQVSFDAGSAIEGFDRGGVPFIEAGDRLRLLLRACTYGPEADPGLRGISKLVVARLGPVRG